MVNQQKKQARKFTREQKAKIERDMKLPVNQLINARNEDGTMIWPIADKLRKYFLDNPDAILDSIFTTNALIHKVRHLTLLRDKILQEYHANARITTVDNTGRVLTREEAYSTSIVHRQNIQSTLSMIRNAIVNNVLQKVDGELFTFQQFNDYVLGAEVVLKEIGFELFPQILKIPKPE